MIRSVVLMFVAFWATAISSAFGASQEDFLLPPYSTIDAPELDLWSTHYYLYSAKEVTVGAPLRDKSGSSLTGNLSLKDWCLGAIEGTVQVSSAVGTKTFNYEGRGKKLQVDCAVILKKIIDPKEKPWVKTLGKSYFKIPKGPFGDGIDGFILVPYRTIAVDQHRIAIGTVLYVPKARGVEISVAPGVIVQHDGYFFAADKGGAIEEEHIDVFCGADDKNCFPSFITGKKAMGFKAFIVRDSSIVAKLQSLHMP